MATFKQLKFVKALQEQCGYEQDEMYSDEEIMEMTHGEISNLIESLKEEIRDDELYNDCMSAGLPNQ
ncbi:hypothetical protein ACN9U3_03080 [Staphylococcus caprae]|uniref:hypothetical protein n=1 Tax=Staphylococcus caprae TaxID=29380 RepID=UPI003B223AB5